MPAGRLDDVAVIADVMSFYSMAFLGISPFGSLFAGVLVNAIDPNNTVIVGGSACLLGAVLFGVRLPSLRALIQPLYVAKGILPEIAAGLGSATKLTCPPED